MAVHRHIAVRRVGRDRGVAAVEFALVMPLFFMLLMGIINYGLWFNDSLSVRQGVREGARRAVVLRASSACTTAFSTALAAYACETRAQMTTTGTPYVKVFYTHGWVRGQELVVCGMVKALNFTGFVPLPAGGLIKSKTTMSIETDTPVPTGASSYADDPTAVGGEWTSWCPTT